jgi:hypothetical protein
MDKCKDDRSDKSSDDASAGDEDWFGDFGGLVCFDGRLPPDVRPENLVNLLWRERAFRSPVAIIAGL